MFGFNKKIGWVAVEIQQGEVRLLQLGNEKQSLHLHQFVSAPLSRDAFAEGKIKNKDLIIDSLRYLVEETETRGVNAIISLPLDLTMSKLIKCAADLSDFYYEKEFKNNLSSYFPGIHEPLCFDFVKLNSDESLLMVARQEDLHDYVRLVNSAGLNLQVVELELLAMHRAAVFKKPNFNPKAILEVYFDRIRLVILESNNWFQSVLPVSTGKGFFTQLINQLRRAILEWELNSIILIGASFDLLAQLAQLIPDECGIDVDCIDPFANIFIPELIRSKFVNHTSSYLTLCGLALRGLYHV